MTNEEAKEIFLNRGFVNGLFDGDKWRQSIVVISKWLEQQPCEDCISREAVLNLTKELRFDSVKGMEDYRYRCICPYDVEDLPSVKPKAKWIPVSERLPKEREWYLAVFKEIDTGYQLIPRVADYIGNGENKWQIIDEDGLGQEYRSILECVAWMPLPEPYKAESEDKE